MVIFPNIKKPITHKFASGKNSTSIHYTYDDRQRISNVDHTLYHTNGTLGTATATQNYSYNSDSTWGDQLSGTTYDAIGNPTTYNGYSMEWNGRQLERVYISGMEYLYNYVYEYNADGIRTSKTINGTEHIYTLNGSQIVSETWGTRMVIYLYDESGSPIGLQYRDSSYGAYAFDTFYFEKNLQGDITAVYNADGEKIGSYTYDAWGVCTTSVVSGNTTLENAIVRNYNPFRYRGYYYDVETGYYYLQSRYYNPNYGRFLNADGLVSTGTGLLGYNMYAYCNNNPISYADSTGEWPRILIFAIVAIVVVSMASCRTSYGNTTPNESMSPEEESEWLEDSLAALSRYETKEEAIEAGLNYVQDASKRVGTEVQGFVYEEHGGYYYKAGTDNRYSNSQTSVYKIELKDTQTLVALFHSHPIVKDTTVFSQADWENGKKFGVDTYVIDPKGNIYKLSPDASDFTVYTQIK